MHHAAFVTTSRALDRAGLPMRLFEKAKRLGVWNPSAIDMAQDRRDWLALDDQERDLVLRLAALFQAGEEAVTLDLLPLIQVIAREGRLEEELFLTSFLFEEAKHTDLFRRFLDEVAVERGDLSRYHTASFRALIHESLPDALQRLSADPSPAAQLRAALTYNMIVEGVLAETGYHAFGEMLARRGLMPGMRAGVALLKQDESRHIAYGVFLIARLIAADDSLWGPFESGMNELFLHAAGVIDEAFSAYAVVPFGLTHDAFMGYALAQFQRRFDRIERARGASMADLAAWDVDDHAAA
jgi:ribonucleoside-diphosphate reductase beta chain